MADKTAPAQLASQEQLNADPELLSNLISKLEEVEWVQSYLDGVSIIRRVGKELKDLRTALWRTLVANKKIGREDDSGNLLRVRGYCTLTISKMTYIVPIALIGKPPSIGGLSLEIGSIAYVETG
ncbi:unnamed protein product [Clonostachys chloroleuca]|uniref:Uncharacterized protein n=1 Tax=Clonostachys chloroleuca TaxID=1926264 RepID=A0AA35M8W7_9HYPO|nr:unnamed protein product [Clonostachys chloroleuca]